LVDKTRSFNTPSNDYLNDHKLTFILITIISKLKQFNVNNQLKRTCDLFMHHKNSEMSIY